MVIEIIGSPGSGKSYMADKLSREFKNRGIQAVNMTEFLYTTFLGRGIKRCLLKGIELNCVAKDLRAELISTLHSDCQWTSQFGLYANANYQVNMAVLNLLIQQKCKSNEVYIFDEGAVYSVVKMMVEFERDYLTTEKILNLVKDKTRANGGIILYNSAEPEVCFKSIKTRNRHVCAFDEFQDDKLNKILNLYKKYCDYISDDQGVIKIDRDESIQNNVESVIQEYMTRVKL